jgi:hypothetical protein
MCNIFSKVLFFKCFTAPLKFEYYYFCAELGRLCGHQSRSGNLCGISQWRASDLLVRRSTDTTRKEKWLNFILGRSYIMRKSLKHYTITASIQQPVNVSTVPPIAVDYSVKIWNDNLNISWHPRFSSWKILLFAILSLPTHLIKFELNPLFWATKTSF